MILQMRWFSAFPISPGRAGRCRPLTLGTKKLWTEVGGIPVVLGNGDVSITVGRCSCERHESATWHTPTEGYGTTSRRCTAPGSCSCTISFPAAGSGQGDGEEPACRAARSTPRAGGLAWEGLTSFSCVNGASSPSCPFYVSGNFPGCVSPFEVFLWAEQECSRQMRVFGLLSTGREWVKPGAVQENSLLCYSAFPKILWLCRVNYVVNY